VSDVVGYQRFGGPCCLHHPEDGSNMVLRNYGILLRNRKTIKERVRNLVPPSDGRLQTRRRNCWWKFWI